MAKVYYSTIRFCEVVRSERGMNAAVSQVLDTGREALAGATLEHATTGILVAKDGEPVSTIPWGNVEQAFFAPGTAYEDAVAALNDRKAGK